MTRIALTLGLVLASACSNSQNQSWDGTNTWAFEPVRDPFSPSALLDLRSLNEKTAGESGFVKVDAKGDFVLGNGKPVRFWCINSSVGREKPFVKKPLGPQTEPDLPTCARFMAKRGVNMVRLHTHTNPAPDQPIDDIRESERDWVWRTVAAMKKEGIYTTVSPYWAIDAKIGPSWGVATGGQENAAALLFFEPKLQQAYKVWLRKLFAEKNPYTGIPLSQDASVAVIQIQNEDSLLFWTINSLKGDARTMIGKQFAQWVAKKYGTLAAASQKWQGNALPGDNLAGGVLDFHNIWEMTQPRTGGIQARLSDQLQFWTETMHTFNQSVVDYLRKDLGCKQLVNAGNWRTADSLRLFDAERWSYTPTEVDAVNRYVNGYHQGPNEGWAIVNGDKFTSPSVLLDPSLLPLSIKQTLNRPMLVTESSWVLPMAYASEGPFLISAYQSLTGIDGYYWFATSDDEWTQPQSANGYLASQSMWVFADPDMLGNFPASALAYRSGYIQRGANVVEEHRSLDDIWQRKLPIIAEEAGFDPNRDTGDISSKSSVKAFVDTQAFLVGPVQVAFDGEQSKTKAVNLKPYVSDKRITSVTHQVVLDSEKGFCRVDTPCAQGVTAFFAKQPEHKLSDVTLRSQNEYGAAWVVSMDGKPLKSSKKVLVQYGTRCRPSDWAEKPTNIKMKDGKTTMGFEIVNIGKAPWRVQKGSLMVTINNPNLKTATVLDMNGNANGAAKLTRTTSSVSFAFPSAAMYVVLQ